MVFAQNYLRILQHEFAKRVEKNPRFSLRAYAKFLGVSPARLSNVLSGKKGLSDEAARLIAMKLEFDAEQTEFFCALVNSEHSRSQAKRDEFKLKVAEFVKKYQTFFMQASAFEAISDSRHLLLLQILKIERVAAPLEKSLLKSSSEQLDIASQKEMIERMMQLGMIEVQDRHYRVCHECFAGPDQISSQAIRNFHLQVMDRARDAIVRESIEKRDSFFLMLPFEEKRVPEVREKIRAFVDTLIDEYGNHGTADSVYGLSSQFFPLERVK